MNKQLKRKSRKIIACMICLVTFFGGLTIPAKAETASVSSNHYSVSSNNCTVSSNHYSASLKGFRRSSANSVVEPRSTEEKFYQRIDGLTKQSDLSGTYVIANVENETGNCAAMATESPQGLGVKCLSSDNINSSLRNDKKYMLAAGLTEWTFEKAESSSGVDNLYYISTVVGDKIMYFYMSEQDNGIYLGEHNNANSLNVTVLTDGKIKIITKGNTNKLRWYGKKESDDSIFGCSNNLLSEDMIWNESFTLYGTTYHKVEDIDQNKDLSGTYVIANEENDATYYAAMSANSSTNGRLDSNNIEKHLSENHKYINGLELTEWTFERAEGNAYSISTKVNGQKMYLKLSQGASDYSEFSIQLVQSKELVNIGVNSEGRICISNPNDSRSRLDWYGGSAGPGWGKDVFSGYRQETPSKNNYFTLYTREKTYQKLSNVSQETDLSGTYVIANVKNDKNYWAAMSTDSKRFNNVDCLSANIIEKDRFTSDKYISGIEFTEWTFEKDKENTYYISTIVNGQKRYLKLWRNIEDQGMFSIQLLETKNSVKVDVNSDNGRISISNNDYPGNRLEWYGGNAGGGTEIFVGYKQPNPSDNNWFNLYRVAPVLYYDVNLPTKSAMGVELENDEYHGHWVEADLISAVDEEQQLSSSSSVTAKLNDLKTPLDGYFTFEKETYYQSQQIINTLKDHQLSSGKDFEFTGWSVTVDGTEYLFGKDAEASVASDKIDMIRITEGEKSVCVPYGTELKGTWTQISDILSFYINKNGTVLDTEGDVARRDVQKFTGSLGVCRVYYANEIVGDNDTYGKDADEKICSLIVREPDMTTKEIKVVIDYVIGENGDLLSVKDKGYLAENLETAVLKYFKEQEADIKICSPFTKEAIGLNPENCDTNHYGTRWYVLKEDVSDFVHIDGVLEAKTGQILVTKSVYGLDENAITDMEKEFQISAELKDHVSGEYQSYITLKTADDENNAVYRYQRDENSFRWTMNALKDEVYAFEEKNYIADDLYASLVEITERDGGKRTVVLDADKSLTDINVSEVKEIHFKNYYVPVQETGVLSIVKTDAQDADKKLKNAEFTLTPEGAESAEAVVRTTDAEGIVQFEDLQPDVTYLLKETKAPEGYQKTDKTWTVKVSLQEEIAEDGKYIESVVVKIFDNSKNGDEGTICYSYDEIVEYEISNTPETKDDGGSGQPPENEPTDDKKPTGNKKPTGGKKPSSEQKPIVEQKPTDEQKPAENKGGIIPTGDSAKTMLMCGLLVCSIVALCVMGYFKRKK